MSAINSIQTTLNLLSLFPDYSWMFHYVLENSEWLWSHRWMCARLAGMGTFHSYQHTMKAIRRWVSLYPLMFDSSVHVTVRHRHTHTIQREDFIHSDISSSFPCVQWNKSLHKTTQLMPIIKCIRWFKWRLLNNIKPSGFGAFFWSFDNYKE